MTDNDSDDPQTPDEPRRTPGDNSPRTPRGTPPRTPADTPLLLDAMLGKLATYLWMCGYDKAYALDRGVKADDGLLDFSESEGRLLVMRNVELAERADGLLLTPKG